MVNQHPPTGLPTGKKGIYNIIVHFIPGAEVLSRATIAGVFSSYRENGEIFCSNISFSGFCS